jgi:hypothetical protein
LSFMLTVSEPVMFGDAEVSLFELFEQPQEFIVGQA